MLNPGVVVGGAVVSSLVMVPVATARVSVAPEESDNVTLNVSFGSTAVSPMMSTCTVCAVTPGSKVSVPVAAL